MEIGTDVTIRLGPADLTGDHTLALTQSQIKKITDAHQNRSGATLKLSKTQLAYNAKVEGGFITAIAPLLATAGKFVLSSVLPKVLPNLAQGVLAGIGSAAASNLVDKISGKGVLYLKRNGKGCTITPSGNGLYLSPWSSRKGNGLYLKTGSGKYVSGEGLLLGPNSPFKDIPLLGMLL